MTLISILDVRILLDYIAQQAISLISQQMKIKVVATPVYTIVAKEV
jgi:hypothetical protein